jgi:hypothetical protein
MIVRNIKKFSFSLLDPSLLGYGLTFWAMAVTAAVVADFHILA